MPHTTEDLNEPIKEDIEEPVLDSVDPGEVGDKPANTIKTAAVGFPIQLSLTDSINLLNQVLTKMQNDGNNILSTNHLGGNVFQIEFRESTS